MKQYVTPELKIFAMEPEEAITVSDVGLLIPEENETPIL